MEGLRLITLGMVQGLTEFIPVSSSAHLILTRIFLGWKDVGLSVDMALHLGTLLALISYMWKDWYLILTSKRNILTFIIIATIPGAIFGFLLENIAEEYFRSTLIIGLAMSIFGLILFVVDRKSLHNKTLNQMGMKDAVIIGFSQILAIIPGVSRSGATLTGSFLCNLRRDESARFSFLLSVPIIGGAGLVSLIKIFKDASSPIASSDMLLGLISSFVFGYLAVHFMLNYLKSHNTNIFVYYRIIFGVVLIVTSLLKIGG